MDPHKQQQDWAANCINSITTTSNAITMQVTCDHGGILTIHHEFDAQHQIHTHFAMQHLKENGSLSFYDFGFYRHPDGTVVGPVYRD